MKRAALPLFEGFIETPFEQRFQGLLRQAWKWKNKARSRGKPRKQRSRIRNEVEPSGLIF